MADTHGSTTADEQARGGKDRSDLKAGLIFLLAALFGVAAFVLSLVIDTVPN